MNSALQWLKPSVDELQKIVEDFADAIHRFKVGNQLARASKDEEGTGNQNEHRFRPSSDDSFEESNGESKLRMLLEIERRLRLLQHSGDCLQLWQEIQDHMVRMATVLSQRLPQEDKVLAIIDFTFRLTCTRGSNDSVWLLGFDRWACEQMWVKYMVVVMENFCPINNETAEQEQTPIDKEELLTTFQQRLKQWKERTDLVQHKHRHLTDMLHSWPQYGEVRTHDFRHNCAV